MTMIYPVDATVAHQYAAWQLGWCTLDKLLAEQLKTFDVVGALTRQPFTLNHDPRWGGITTRADTEAKIVSYLADFLKGTPLGKAILTSPLQRSTDPSPQRGMSRFVVFDSEIYYYLSSADSALSSIVREAFTFGWMILLTAWGGALSPGEMVTLGTLNEWVDAAEAFLLDAYDHESALLFARKSLAVPETVPSRAG